MKRFEIEEWADDSVGQGFRLYYQGDLVGTAGKIRLLRLWARQLWRAARSS